MPKRKVKTETGAAEPELAIPSADLVVEDASPVKRQKTRGIEKDGGDGNESTRNLARKRGKQVKRSTVPSVEGELVGNVNQPDEGQQTENKSPRRRKVKSEEQVKDIKDEEPDDIITEKKIKRKQKTKAVERAASPEIENKKVEKKVQRKRKTKEEKEAEAMPLAARTVGHKLFIGAHVSASGGQWAGSDSSYRSCTSAEHVSRRTKFGRKQCAYRCQRLCPLPQVAAKMGQPSLTR